jgi:hypothetical protein
MCEEPVGQNSVIAHKKPRDMLCNEVGRQDISTRDDERGREDINKKTYRDRRER